MKIFYFSFLFSTFGIFYFLLFHDALFSEEKILSYNTSLQNTVLKNVSHISDDELYLLAKKINEDGLPGESDYAQILLTEAIRKNPKNINALLEFERLIERQSLSPSLKLQKRLSFVYQAFLIEPNNPKVRYKLAGLFYELNQMELFQQIYSETLQNFPDHLDTDIEKIQSLSKTDPKMAIEISNKALKNGANIADFLPQFLLALEKSDKIENFSKNLLEYTEHYPNRWLWYHLGMQYTKEKKFDNAEYAFQKSILLGNNIAGRLQLAIMQYRNQNKRIEAISNLKFVISNLKGNPYISKDIIYFTHAQLACALMPLKNTRETKNELNFLAQYSFQNHQYFMAMTNEFLKNNQTDLLEEPMKIAIKNDPMFAFPYNVLSIVLKKQKKAKEAQEYYDKFLVLSATKN